jgi:galactokinase
VSTPRDLARRGFAARFGDSRHAREWFVPGRIEVLGKHVDYAGGRSLLAAIDRGFHVVARPRRDHRVHLFDARSQHALLGALDPELPQAPGTWNDYVITVLRRIARDFPGADIGMDAVIASNLPSAAGVSSSSALVIATFLPLARFNQLETRPEWAHLDHAADLAGYLGALENGKRFGPFRSDFGVGTAGGSQDHLAILCGRAGGLTQARFLPASLEAEIPFPAEWSFVVAASGVAAAKGGAVQANYNALAADAATLLSTWNRISQVDEASLMDAMNSDPDAPARLAAALAAHPDAPRLLARLEQFRAETTGRIPEAIAAIGERNAGRFGNVVAASHLDAVRVLENQIPETVFLAERAGEFGAFGASAFGAGFGGSVYAVVATEEVAPFLTAWDADYRARFPLAAPRATFFATPPADGAREVG